MILTDALRTLKGQDTREVAPDSSEDNWGTFFHRGSLGVTQLQEILNAFSKFESLLYGASPEGYRDHIAHAFRVWIIGHALLTEHLGGKLHLHGQKSTDNAWRVKPKEWQCMWAVAALCHDLGYPLAAIEKVNHRARDAFARLGLSPASYLRFSFSQQMLPFHDTIIKTMSSTIAERPKDSGTFLTHLQNKYYLKFLKSFDRLEHGVVSALLISNALVYFLESELSHDERSGLEEEDARQFLIRREILRAIASHTCQDIYHLRFDTLPLLLYMVDEIQCWGRPTFEMLQHGGTDSITTKVKISKFAQRKIQIKVTTSDSSWKEAPEWAIRKLDNLHRMFRLAVGTPELSRRLRLDFRIGPKKGESARFCLSDGRINKSPSKYFQAGGNE